MGLKDSHNSNKNLFAVPLKHSSFLPSAYVKPMPNDLVHAILWQWIENRECSIHKERALALSITDLNNGFARFL